MFFERRLRVLYGFVGGVNGKIGVNIWIKLFIAVNGKIRRVNIGGKVMV